MKLKNLTMAIMVASLGAASVAAQADSSWYGSVRIGIEHVDDGSNDTTSFRNWYSRMGFKGETDLENGLTAFGHYEFSVDTDNADNGNGALGTRKAYVGLKGGSGVSVLVAIIIPSITTVLFSQITRMTVLVRVVTAVRVKH